MYVLHYEKLQYNLPQGFNELTKKQLIDISYLLHQEEDDNDVQNLKALQILLGLPKLDFFLLHDDLKYRMLPYIKWVFEENKLTSQLINSYNGFYGPKSELLNFTLGEFHLAEIYYHDFVVEKDEAALNKLIAVLYRLPKKKYKKKLDSDGDIRKEFNANEVAYFSHTVKKWPHAVRLAILAFYDGCRQHLIDLYDRVFEGGSSNKHTETEAGMFDVIRGLSGPKYGDINNVEKVYVHTALHELEKQIIEAEELERQMNAS